MNPTYGIILWIVIGGLAGWSASKMMGTSDRQGPFVDVFVGITGALLGGYLTQWMFGDEAGNNGFLASLGIAVLGACLLIGLGKVFFKRRS